MATIFSKIISGEIPCYKVAENDDFIAFLDINPIAKGHTLVIPKKEISYIFDMDDVDLQKMIIFAKNVAKAIESVVPCVRIGVAVIGLEVPHTHIHLSPITNVGDLSFSGERINMSVNEFKDLCEKISSAFVSLNSKIK